MLLHPDTDPVTVRLRTNVPPGFTPVKPLIWNCVPTVETEPHPTTGFAPGFVIVHDGLVNCRPDGISSLTELIFEFPGSVALAGALVHVTVYELPDNVVEI